MKLKIKTFATLILIIQIVLIICLLILHFDQINISGSGTDVKTNMDLSSNVTNIQLNAELKTAFVGEGIKTENKVLNLTVEETGSCKRMNFLGKAEEEKWQPVDKENLAFVFSAYYIELNRKIVIVAAKVRRRYQFYCQMWFQHEGKYSMKEVVARDNDVPEDHKKKYSATLFYCPLSGQGYPSSVSLVSRQCAAPTNMLKVSKVPNNFGVFHRRFTVCLTPLNFNYSRGYEFIEWLELNKLLGAQKVIIYNNSVAQNVDQILRWYSAQGTVKVIQWQLPMKVKTNENEINVDEIHYYGQLAALQDCLYRNKQVSEFVVNTDLDEFIIPLAEKTFTWHELLSQLNHKAGAYIFRNTFFRKEWTTELANSKFQSYIDKYRLTTLEKLYREEKVYQPRQRSKYFARTSDVDKLMIHNVVSLPKHNKPEVVPENVGLLHHYRDWQGEFPLPSKKVLSDVIPKIYGKYLVRNVEKVWTELGEKVIHT